MEANGINQLVAGLQGDGQGQMLALLQLLQLLGAGGGVGGFGHQQRQDPMEFRQYVKPFGETHGIPVSPVTGQTLGGAPYQANRGAEMAHGIGQLGANLIEGYRVGRERGSPVAMGLAELFNKIRGWGR